MTYFRNLLIVFILILHNYHALSQNQVKFEGKIINEDNIPIEFAYVVINKTSIGTMTNSSGNYSIKIPYNIFQPEIVVSCIGYETKYLKSNDFRASYKTIKLKSNKTPINSVIIMPDTSLRNLLRRAFMKIKDNYPDKPQNYENFYRETLISNDKILYFAEALFKTYKSSYVSKYDYQMEMLKSRKYLASNIMDTTIRMKLYGGAFNSQFLDFVFNKESFINPNSFSSYIYKLVDITTFNNDSVYVINFYPQKKGSACYNGKLYIDKESLAYVSADYTTEEGFLNTNLLDAVKLTWTSRVNKTNYIKVDKKWQLKYCKSEGILFPKSTKKEIDVTLESINTKIIDSTATAIPYDKRYNFMDIFIDNAINYDSAYWKDYTILEQDSTLKSNFKLQINNSDAQTILNQKPPESKSFLVYLLKFVRNLSLGYELSYSPLITNFSNATITYYQNNNTILSHSNNFKLNIPQNIITSSYNYFLNKNWYISFDFSSSLKTDNFCESYALGSGWRKNIKKYGKPLFIQPSLYITYGYYGANIGGFNNIGNFNIADYKIISKSFNVYLGERQIGLKSGVSFLYPINGFFKLSFSMAYQYSLINTNMVFIESYN